MHLANPAQLRRDLKEAAALRKWLGIDLVRAAVRLSEAGQEDEAKELQRIAASYQDVEDRLAGYADEVNGGRILRGKAE
ncbi:MULTISPECIES: hypothetical protein [Pseudomonas]|uniref:Uncharacterized protein n=2 Tax=Pseudomonas TaxID=286 RepID=A0A0D0SH28_PSEFL|nr:MULTISPECIES: hypothetical protein [Pseudomonas fluorescens group]AZE62121.1 hypothetical protein C4K02_3766 [Pseudomonas synxantha]KIR21383.1 hypothetical protein PFLU3_32040 [Pseudomonas fluorescens]